MSDVSGLQPLLSLLHLALGLTHPSGQRTSAGDPGAGWVCIERAYGPQSCGGRLAHSSWADEDGAVREHLHPPMSR